MKRANRMNNTNTAGVFTALLILLAASAASTPLRSAEIRFDESGSVLQVIPDGMETVYRPDPRVTRTISLDGSTNTALMREVSSESHRFSFNNGLLRDGQPVPVNGDGTLKISLSEARQIWNSIRTQQAFDSLTAAQKAEALRRSNKLIILLLVKEGILSPEDFQ